MHKGRIVTPVGPARLQTKSRRLSWRIEVRNGRHASASSRHRGSAACGPAPGAARARRLVDGDRRRSERGGARAVACAGRDRRRDSQHVRPRHRWHGSLLGCQRRLARERVRAQQRRAGDGHRDRHRHRRSPSAAGQACAVLADGTVRCWGNNEYGQLGTGARPGRSCRSTVLGIGSAVAVAAGGVHTCALLADGAVACWGFSGAIGDGSFSSRLAPVPVDGIDDGVALAAGSSHTCVLRAGGGIACWGSNEAGQLGDGTRPAGADPDRGGRDDRCHVDCRRW